MEVYTTSQARINLFKIVENSAYTSSPTYIVGKKNKVVLISEDDYRSLMETLYITSIPGMKESILAARDEPRENFSTALDWKNV